MKKLIIIGLLALVLSPTLALAQTSSTTQEEINAQLLQIINTLMKQVQELMVKLIAIEATQTQQTQTLGVIQTQTNKPVVTPSTSTVQTTPVIDKAIQCEPLKKNLWELWDLNQFIAEFNLPPTVNGGTQESVSRAFLLYQDGGRRGQTFYSCPSYGTGANPDSVKYGMAGCQKFISENPEWVACMKSK